MSKRKIKRYARRPTVDKGTDELRQHRQAASGNPNTPHDSPLDVLHSLDLISDVQARAGQQLALIRFKAWGAPRGWRSTQDLYAKMVAQVDGKAPPTEPGGGADVRRHQEYDRAIAALKSAGPNALHEVTNAAIYCQVPSWIAGQSLQVTALREVHYRALCAGLDALALHFGFEMARAA